MNNYNELELNASLTNMFVLY